MTPAGSRLIYKSRWRGPSEARELIETICTAESLSPSRCLWIISPWLSDLPVMDNRSGAFTGLRPSWDRRPIRLTEVLSANLKSGNRVVIATRPDSHNDTVIERLLGAMGDGSESLLTVHRTEHLHEKGIVGDEFHLSGSMNLTFNGVELLEELLRYDTTPAIVAEARLAAHARWGGFLAPIDHTQ